MQYLSHYSSPLGPITLASDGQALIGLWFDGQKYFGNTIFSAQDDDSLPVFNETRRWLDQYFNGQCPNFTPKLKLIGSDFRQLVWKNLLSIPYGNTTTYKAIGQKVAQAQGRASMSAQAVGGAVGHNPISIIIPCHRVISTSGNLTGYAGGLSRKEQLLQIEHQAI